MKVLVTGATGFIGPVVCEVLRAQGHSVRAAVRRAVVLPGVETVDVGDLHGATPWDRALQGIDAVIHVAGLAHQFGADADDVARFTAVNVDATAGLAAAAASHGVRRFVFLSTAKVSGESSPPGGFRESGAVHPEGAYAVSKAAAEERVRAVAAGTGMEATIVRTPLVYGPGVRANFLALMRIVDRRIPLPFGAVRNARSIIYVRNLADALVHCAGHPDAANETFFVRDRPDTGTPQLIRAIATALGRRALLVPVPQRMMELALRAIGREETGRRLFGSLAVDDDRIRGRTGWVPPYTMAEGLAATARWYRGLGSESPGSES